MVKKISPISRIAKHTRPQGTFHNGPQGIVIVEVMRSFQ